MLAGADGEGIGTGSDSAVLPNSLGQGLSHSPARIRDLGCRD